MVMSFVSNVYQQYSNKQCCATQKEVASFFSLLEKQQS